MLSSPDPKPPTYKSGFCTECGVTFRYPSNIKPRPILCDLHDPETPLPIEINIASDIPEEIKPDLVSMPSTWTNVGSTITSTSTLIGCNPSPQWVVIDNPGWPNDPPSTPRGSEFHRSPRVKSAAAIREEYRSRISKVQNPQILEVHLPRPKNLKREIIGINHLGDIHVGTDACVYDAFKETLAYILKTDGEYLALQGDMVDCLTGVSVGVMAEQAMTIQDQFTLIADDLYPLAKARKILWMLRGNHEERMDKATKNIVDAAQSLARQLDVAYLAMEGYSKVTCNSHSYISFNVHGFPAGRSAGARRNKMERVLAEFPDADIVTCGHNHILDAIPTYEEVIRNDKRVQRQRWGLYTGTFHSYSPSYAADTVLGPGSLGYGRVEFNIVDGSLSARAMPIIHRNGKYRPALAN